MENHLDAMRREGRLAYIQNLTGKVLEIDNRFTRRAYRTALKLKPAEEPQKRHGILNSFLLQSRNSYAEAENP